MQGDANLLGTRLTCILCAGNCQNEQLIPISTISAFCVTHIHTYVFIHVYTHRYLGILKFLCSLLTFLVVPQSLRFSYPNPIVKQCQRGQEQSSSECNTRVVLRNLVCQARYSCASVNLSLWSKFTVEFNT